MYYAHFGLKEPPFKITPNTEFFFNGNNRGQVLDALIYAITSGEGIVKVVGEVGSGKTMLCRMLQNMLPDHVESVYLANPSVAPEDILHAIAFELGVKLPKSADRLKVMQALQAYLLERHEAGKQVVIFVEEAQGMPLATLEEIRLLSNLETKHDKLLQMVLFGQPELDVNLNQTQIRQLRERITHSFNLTPLRPKEVGEYIIFRLRAAGYHGPHLFTDKSIHKIASAAEGLIRRVNILADKSLLAAFADNVYLVTPKHVQAAIADSEFGAEKAKKTGRKLWFLGLIGVLLVGLLLGYLTNYFFQKAFLQTAKPEVASKAAEPAQPKQVNISNIPVSSASTPAAPSNAGNTTNVVQPVTQTKTEIHQTAIAEPLQEPQLDILQGRLLATKQWMSMMPKETVTIQILGASGESQLKSQLTYLAQAIELDKIYVYQTKLNQQDFYTVLYGSYANRFIASEALKQLPQSIQKNRPQLRTIGGILDETHTSP
ncbi:MAG TPA: general secretion pathway protein [Methylophilaceae bacterium]|nr:general secretion pathway protein [Methylophilaceae bacterium]HAJ73134.1 general secretion pathway protein [Methylophilaceae bacterium]